MMEYCVNEELDDNNQNDLNEWNKTGLNEEELDKSKETENDDVIYRSMNVNEKDTNRYTLEEVI